MAIEIVPITGPIIFRILWLQILQGTFAAKIDLDRKAILNAVQDSLTLHLTSALTAPEITELNLIVSSFNFSAEDLLNFDPEQRLPSAIDLNFVVTATLDADAPDNWAPAGLNGFTQAIVIIGNSTDVKINSIVRRTPAGRSIFIVNGKSGDATITLVNSGTGAAENLIKNGNGDITIGNGANISLASIGSPINGYSFSGAALSAQQPTGFDPSNKLVVVLNSDAPDDWNPAGLTSKIQAIIIGGNSSNVDINTLDRSQFGDGHGLLIINNKSGNGKITFKDNLGGTPTNRFIGGLGNVDIFPGGTLNVVSSANLDRWSEIIAKF